MRSGCILEMPPSEVPGRAVSEDAAASPPRGASAGAVCGCAHEVPREEVRLYIQEQETHHRTVSFQEEFRAFLARYEVEYEERYVWD